jgi:hypothetical protein
VTTPSVQPVLREWWLIFAACALLASRLVVALIIIPPWQQPDEPTHVALVEAQKNRTVSIDAADDPAREQQILRSMARYRWWEHRAVGFEPPEQLPERFIRAGRGVAVANVANITKPAMYFRVVSWLLAWLPARSVVADMYVLRAFSALLGLLTFWIAWLGARECLGPLGGAIVAVLLSLHPQFAVVSTGATPDALVNLLGACLWWQGAIVLGGQRSLWPLALVWLSAVAAAASDRMGVPLLAVALVVSCMAIVPRVKWNRVTALVTLLAIGLAAASLFVVTVSAIDAIQNTFGWPSVFPNGQLFRDGAVTWDRFTRFTLSIHQSWWSAIGWGLRSRPRSPSSAYSVRRGD